MDVIGGRGLGLVVVVLGNVGKLRRPRVELQRVVAWRYVADRVGAVGTRLHMAVVLLAVEIHPDAGERSALVGRDLAGDAGAGDERAVDAASLLALCEGDPTGFGGRRLVHVPAVAGAASGESDGVRACRKPGDRIPSVRTRIGVAVNAARVVGDLHGRPCERPTS